MRARKALNELMNNSTLIINRADKGYNTVVVQDRSDHIDKTIKHFADQKVYKQTHNYTRIDKLKKVMTQTRNPSLY